MALPIRVEVTFHGINYVSDRTARETLKSLSKAMRRAQMAEIVQLLKRMDLPLDQYQSLESTTLAYLSDAPLLSIKKASEGSWAILAVVGGFGLWFLKSTIGKSIEEGWKKTPAHEAIVDYVENFRPQALFKLFKASISAQPLGERWIVRDVVIKENRKGARIIAHIYPIEGLDIEHAEFIDDKVLAEKLARRIGEP